MAQRGVGALIVMPDPLFNSRREQLVELAARHTMPGIYPVRVYPEIGGLMSYGSGCRDLYERSGIYVGKILEGAKPADLPIQQIGDQSQDGESARPSSCRWNYVQSPTMRSTTASGAVIIPFRIADLNSVTSPALHNPMRPYLPAGPRVPHEPGSVLQSRQLNPWPFLGLDYAPQL